MRLRVYSYLIALALFTASQAQSPTLDPTLGITTIPLYDHPVPGTPADQPTLTVFSPPGKNNGSAILVAPGGAYLHLASNLEGREVADWFASRGFTAFVLKYRLGPDNLYPIPLDDARHAIRLVRSMATTYGFAPDRIGIIGFSAGGHLAASTATLSHAAGSIATTGVDVLSDKPDFVILGYPWLNAMEPQVDRKITYCSVLPKIPPATCAGYAQQYTPRLQVTRDTPTTFLFAATDDDTVPVSASVQFYEAMVKAGAPVEMHLFRHGGHGFGLGKGDAALDQWPALLEQWLREQGLMTPPAASQPHP